MTTYYKITGPDGTPCNGGSGAWDLPKNGKPGKWRRVEGKLEPCLNGLHVARSDQILEWLNGLEIYEVEIGRELIDHGDKIVARRARLVRKLNWDDRTARLFAVDCAKRAVRKAKVTDPRSLNALKVAERYANGKASDKELAAARDAAWDAAWDAERDAARDAARAAARAAARDAARDAAWVAVWDAVWDAERKWQTKRLLEYLNGERG